MKSVPIRRPLTAAETVQLDALHDQPDTNDIPEATEAQWTTAIRGKFYRPRKEAISLRLDMDVLDWLRRQGPGYQTTINRILRERMEAERPKT
jgi:uncharacterized protein (DUF4415 family)